MSGPTSGDSLKAQAMREARVFSYQVLLHTAIDARDCRGLGEFYRQFLGLRYRRRPSNTQRTNTGDRGDWPGGICRLCRTVNSPSASAGTPLGSETTLRATTALGWCSRSASINFAVVSCQGIGSFTMFQGSPTTARGETHSTAASCSLEVWDPVWLAAVHQTGCHGYHPRRDL
jgi:hypothetical protein